MADQQETKVVGQNESQRDISHSKVWSKPTYDVLKTDNTAGGTTSPAPESSTSKPSS